MKRKKAKETYKLKVGDLVWVRVPTNAVVKSINRKYGYTLSVKEDCDMSYFHDGEVSLIRKPKKK